MNTALQSIDKSYARECSLKKASQFVGRRAGKRFTHYAGTGGRAGRKFRQLPKVKQLPVSLTFTMLVTIGTLVRLHIKIGDRLTAFSVVDALVFGDVSSSLSPTAFQRIYAAYNQCSSLRIRDIDSADTIALKKLSDISSKASQRLSAYSRSISKPITAEEVLHAISR